MQNAASATKKTTTLLAGAALSLGLMGGIAAPANAAQNTASPSASASDIHSQQIGPNKEKVTSTKVSFLEEGGVAKMKDNATGKVLDLPEYKTGDNGQKIYLAYHINKDGSLLVAGLNQKAPSSSGVNTYSLKDDAKCWGTVFSDSGGGAMAGATAGSIAGPEGAAGGALLGSVVGGVKGATSC